MCLNMGNMKKTRLGWPDQYFGPFRWERGRIMPKKMKPVLLSEKLCLKLNNTHFLISLPVGF